MFDIDKLMFFDLNVEYFACLIPRNHHLENYDIEFIS